MKIEIRIGDTSSNKRVKYHALKLDCINDEKKRMYDFLNGCEDCIIEDVDMYLLYALNNCIMAFIIKDNVELKEEVYENDACNLIPKIDPAIYRVFEIMEDGTEFDALDNDGKLAKNYFDQLMGNVMNDFYSCINFYN